MPKKKGGFMAEKKGKYHRIRSRISTRPSSYLKYIPHILSNVGLSGFGYNAVGAFQSGNITEGLKMVATNELMLFTGYDAIGRGFNALPPLANYGALIAGKLVGKHFRGI